MTKKGSSESFAVKMEIFSKKRSLILVRELFVRPPKLDARSPAMIIYFVSVLL